MKILIAGLGLIGASFAKALKNEYFIAGFDKQEVLSYAINNKIINEKAENFNDYDFVLIALPPKETIDFINNHKFKNGAIVADICGIKKQIENSLDLKNRNFYYVGCHPMAGKEVSGISNSDQNLFKNASLIITQNGNTDTEALKTSKNILSKAGFSEVIVCSAEKHDKIIAYTSQLAHIVSNAYVKSDTINYYKGFTGGSFQDMTRIASLNEEIWTDLFFYNRANLIDELHNLICNLSDFERALITNDKDRMKKLLKQGKEINKRCNKLNKILQ